ncbi:OmpA family protein [Psychromonas sp. RZ22]|uniref:OmpA family protein n=1 Tax=Psychromonas algarum TaxID=2555643 RepID=UPI001067B33D|nr:OmpA family protein [Psychromonas sp. RZ22]TEW55377.1 OmpA family protein [Psychromonas sp. RZ22]
MKKVSALIGLIFLSGCSTNAIDMAPEPTKQAFDLSDEEGDGVITARDNCPNSFAGAAVDSQGCSSEVVEKIRRKLLVNFATDSSYINPKYYNEIKGLADFMKEYPSVDVTIEGHTSIRGQAAYNKKLSLRRAEAIKKLLVGKYAIEENRVKAKGYGSEQPLLEGNDEYIHAKNRRIVAEIVSERKIVDMKWTIYSVDDRTQ